MPIRVPTSADQRDNADYERKYVIYKYLFFKKYKRLFVFHAYGPMSVSSCWSVG